MDNIKLLPKCITHLILQKLGLRDLINFRQVSKYCKMLFNYNLKYFSISLHPFRKNVKDCHLKIFNGVKLINLENCNITTLGIKYLLENNNTTKKINLMATYIDDDCFQYMSNIEELDLSECPNVKYNCLKYLKNIKILNLGYIDNLNDVDFSQLSSLSNLKELYLDHAYSFLKPTNLKSLTHLITLYLPYEYPDPNLSEWLNKLYHSIKYLEKNSVKIITNVDFNNLWS